jgi:hypothetical protein
MAVGRVEEADDISEDELEQALRVIRADETTPRLPRSASARRPAWPRS